MRTVKDIFLLSLLPLFSVAAFSEELTYARTRTDGLDIELSQVQLVAAVSDENRIAYRFELAEGKKLSCIETQRTLRIRQLTPSRGTLYLFIPKAMVLENCSIRVNRADIRIEGLQAVHLLTTMNMGAITFKECRLKNAVINLAHGTLTFNQTEIVRSCAFTLTGAVADIVFPSEEMNYHLDYVQNGGSLTIAGKEYTKTPGEYGNTKAKQRIIFSSSMTAAVISFMENGKK